MATQVIMDVWKCSQWVNGGLFVMIRGISMMQAQLADNLVFHLEQVRAYSNLVVGLEEFGWMTFSAVIPVKTF